MFEKIFFKFLMYESNIIINNFKKSEKVQQSLSLSSLHGEKNFVFIFLFTIFLLLISFSPIIQIINYYYFYLMVFSNILLIVMITGI